MTIQPGYLATPSGEPLYAAYHPAQPGACGVPVVIAPPLFEERKSAYGTLRRLAEKLAAAGHAALGFDYRGSGESGGEPGARRWAQMNEDLAAAQKALLELSGQTRCALLGLRVGGTLVLQNAASGNVAGVIALAPIVSGSAQVRLWRMRSKIRAELTAAETGGDAGTARRGDGGATATATDRRGEIDFDGFAVHPGFFEDVAGIDLAKNAAPLSCPGLVMQLSHRTDAAPETARLMERLGPRAKLTCLRIEPFWDKLDDVDTALVEAAVLAAVAEMSNANP